MKAGYLTDFFGAIGWKRLAHVEIDPKRSNQHEFNGSKTFTSVLGSKERRIKNGTGIPSRFLHFREGFETPIEERLQLSWYDSRRRGTYPNAKVKKRAPEFRIFYQKNSIVGKGGTARAGDLLIIAFAKDFSEATVIIAEQRSTFESQLLWLFGIEAVADAFEVHAQPPKTVLDLTRTHIIETLGISVPVVDNALLDRLLAKFGEAFPSSAVFSAFARKAVRGVIAIEDPDTAIVRWMEQEEIAFRVLEKFLVEKRLQKNFKDVDEFVSYSLSVQNRRKSRAGAGFENHLNALFIAHKLLFAWRAEVENKAKPDFLFTGIAEYRNTAFPAVRLTILGAKTSCKDRWRQVLSEGKRVAEKHLVTLEPAISSTQMAEMKENSLQLVVPESVRHTYSPGDQSWVWTWVWSVSRFIEFVAQKQK
jgi:hypothetical protein